VGGARLPEVTIVDMRAEHRARRERDPHDQRVHLLGPTLEGEIARTLRAGGQVMVLHNRRGFASYIWCRNASCRNVVSCDHCDANLVVHRHEGLPPRGVVRCHHCEAEQRVPSGCPVCGGHVALWGGGTQRAEVEFEQKFMAEGLEPGKTMLRLDSDSMRGAGEYHRALSRFARGEVRLLLGTQMIAKGLDFPDVRLVGIIDADLSLLIPDFRSAERTFQLVSQVAGRAGRGLHAGRVIVQTMNPESPAIVLAAGHDFASFAAFEMASRERAGLPPFSRMANIVCRDRDLAKARAAAGALAEVFGGVGVRVRGPMPCVISRIAGFHRVCVTITADSAGALQRALSAARARGILRSDAHTAVDVDPVSLM
jgi:primosomal protein N' (replication factor Y) (superfamily II helicase)